MEGSNFIEYSNGDKCWYKNGKLHRDGGPAIERSNGNKAWYKGGDLHREDGPAIEFSDREVEYWVNGVRYPTLPTEEDILTREIIE
jgi:hypothetical protein